MLAEAKRRTTTDAYLKANDRLREWMNRRLDDQALDIAKLYRVDRNRLLFRLGTVYEQYLRDDPTFVRARLTGATYAIDNAIREHVEELARELNSNAAGSLTVLMNMQPKAVQRHLQRYSRLDFKDLPWPSRNVLNELTTGVTGGGTFFDHMTHVTDGLKSKVTSDVRLSLLNGDKFDDLRDKLMKTFGVDKLAEPKGSAYGSVKVYKNEARRQWNLLMRQQARQANGEEIWYATLDEASTPGCVARHGRRLSELDDAPPRHINCRCQILVVERGDDLSQFRAEADTWLAQEGYSRRSAAQMESEQGFPWGTCVLRPLMQFEPAARDHNLFAYRPLARLDVPRFTAGVALEGDWYGTEAQAQSAGDPDSVLTRTNDLAHASQAAEVRTTQGWAPLKTQRGRWAETVQGFFLDSPAIGPTWEPRKRRLTLDLIDRWPRMRGVTWTALRPDEVYAVRLMSVTEARAASLGIMPDQNWLTGTDPSELIKALIAQGLLVKSHDPHVAVAIVPADSAIRSSQPELQIPVAHIDADDVDSIFNLSTGTAIYARDSFNGGLLSPYQRVAVLCFEPDHKVWAVRPRGRFFWALPGGHIEKNETAQFAAQREMEEETGVSVTILASLGVIYRPWSTTTVFLARRDQPVSAPLLPEEIDAAAPIPLDNLEDTDRTWIQRKWDFIKASRVLVEGVGRWKKLFKVVEAFDPAKHPRGRGGRWATTPGETPHEQHVEDVLLAPYTSGDDMEPGSAVKAASWIQSAMGSDVGSRTFYADKGVPEPTAEELQGIRDYAKNTQGTIQQQGLPLSSMERGMALSKDAMRDLDLGKTFEFGSASSFTNTSGAAGEFASMRMSDYRGEGFTPTVFRVSQVPLTSVVADTRVSMKPWDKGIGEGYGIQETITAGFRVQITGMGTQLIKSDSGEKVRVRVVDVKPVARTSESVHVLEAFDPKQHPRGARGTHMGGKFVPKGSGVSSPTYKSESPSITKAILTRTPSSATVGRLVQRPEYTGQWQKAGYTYGHPTEYAHIGENVVAAVLRQTDPSAHLVKPEGKFATNYAFDGIEKGAAFDVKTSPISVGKDNIDNRQWRYTFDTKGWERDQQKGMSADRWAKYNEGKADAVILRKTQAAQDIANVTGKSITARVYGVILNPKSATAGRADIYKFDGLNHARIGWGRVERIKGNYVGTVSYTYKPTKKESAAWLETSPLLEAEAPTLDNLSDWSKDFWRSRGLLDALPPTLLVGLDRELEGLYQGWIAQLLTEFGDEAHGH